MFDTFELSRFSGRPLRLFVFRRQGTYWRYASGDRAVEITAGTYAGIYLPAQIQRDEIQQTIESAKDKLKIKFAYLRDPSVPESGQPTTQALGNNWNPFIPSDSVYVTCLATHVGSGDAPQVEWQGVVSQPSFTDVELELICEPGIAISEATNQGPKWQRACWKTVYSTGLRGCNLDPIPLSVTATLAAATGLTLTAAEFAAAPLNLSGGDIAWMRTDGLIERRSIMSHEGSAITILYAGADLDVGTEVVARPGCPQTWVACAARSNTIHYGGAIYKPVKNPQGESMSWG